VSFRPAALHSETLSQKKKKVYLKVWTFVSILNPLPDCEHKEGNSLHPLLLPSVLHIQKVLRIYLLIDWLVVGWLVGWLGKWMDGCGGVWVWGFVGGWVDEWMMDGWTDGKMVG
jgi:hypothetical protein